MQRQPAAFSPRLENVRMQVCPMWWVETDKSIVYFLLSFLFLANAKLNTNLRLYIIGNFDHGTNTKAIKLYAWNDENTLE